MVISRRPHQPPPSSDDQLLDRVALGDQSALDVLRRRYEVTVYALAYGILLDRTEADEVVNGTFSELWWLAPWVTARHIRLRPWLMNQARILSRVVHSAALAQT